MRRMSSRAVAWQHPMALDSSTMALLGFSVYRLATCNAPFAIHALHANFRQLNGHSCLYTLYNYV